MVPNQTDIEQLKQGNALAFARLYCQYHTEFYYNIFNMVNREELAWEILHSLVFEIWNTRESLDAEQPFELHLHRYRAAAISYKKTYRQVMAGGHSGLSPGNIIQSTKGIPPERRLVHSRHQMEGKRMKSLAYG